MNYITKGDTIIFHPSFDQKLDHELLTDYKKIIFSEYVSNCELKNELFDFYENEQFLEVLKYKGTHFYLYDWCESKFNQPVDSIPSSITHLIFGSKFNQPVNNLQSSITHLTFDFKFNQPVNNLPSSGLTHLTFGYCFDHSVDLLPSSITHLTFDFKFNQPVNNLSSSVLTHLTFGYTFNQPIDSLPSSITHLIFDFHSVFNQILNNLPLFIEFIELPFKYNNPISNIPSKLKVIKCSSKYKYSKQFVGIKVIMY